MTSRLEQRGWPQIWFAAAPMGELRPVPLEIQRWFDEGPEKVAHELAGALDEIEEKPARQCEYKPIEINYLSYALLHWCARNEIEVPAELMRLLWRLLGLDKGPTPPDAVATRFGWPAARDLDAFIEAADTEAREPEISRNQLAQRIGVDRKTLRQWQDTDPYRRRIAATRARER